MVFRNAPTVRVSKMRKAQGTGHSTKTNARATHIVEWVSVHNHRSELSPVFLRLGSSAGSSVVSCNQPHCCHYKQNGNRERVLIGSASLVQVEQSETPSSGNGTRNRNNHSQFVTHVRTPSPLSLSLSSLKHSVAASPESPKGTFRRE